MNYVIKQTTMKMIIILHVNDTVKPKILKTFLRSNYLVP